MVRDRLRIAIAVLLCAALASRASVPAEVGLALIGATLTDATSVRLRTTATALALDSPGEAGVVLRLSRVFHDVALALALFSLLYVLRPF